MTLQYGFAKARVTGAPWLKGSRRKRETQYHLHAAVDVAGTAWDVAINVGTDDADDLLQFKLVYDFHHPLAELLAAAPPGRNDLTGTSGLPALDFQRSDVLAECGDWRRSGVMDGSLHPEPVASVARLLTTAFEARQTVYLFGRFYTQGNGIHDTHMNQGSGGGFIHTAGNDSNDHNDVWQDGGVLADLGGGRWAAYFSAFQKQFLPTDNLGNPEPGATPVGS